MSDHARFELDELYGPGGVVDQLGVVHANWRDASRGLGSFQLNQAAAQLLLKRSVPSVVQNIRLDPSGFTFDRCACMLSRISSFAGGLSAEDHRQLDALCHRDPLAFRQMVEAQVATQGVAIDFSACSAGGAVAPSSPDAFAAQAPPAQGGVFSNGGTTQPPPASAAPVPWYKRPLTYVVGGAAVLGLAVAARAMR